MNNNIFIPKKVRVGFQSRQGTYTGQLAYVIYYGADNKLKKETSWEQWRDKKIDPKEFENVPTEGFVLNKDVQRGGWWSHYGSNRSYIRVYDPRGIEFEITPENLITVLMETDCNHRELKGQFIYGWMGGDLILLPCCSEIYQNAMANTTLKTSKFSARDFKEGRSYTTKDGRELVYMGRMAWTEWPQFSYYREDLKVVTKRKHVFWDVSDEQFEAHDGASKIAHQNSDECANNYAELTDWLDSTPGKYDSLSIKVEPETHFKLLSDRYTNINFYKEKDGRIWLFEAHRINYHLHEEGEDLSGQYLISIRGSSPLEKIECTRFTIVVDNVTHTGNGPGRYHSYSSPRNSSYVQESKLREFGLTSLFNMPDNEALKQRAKDDFFGLLVKPYISLPNGARHELTSLNVPNPNKPWKND